MAIAIAFCPVGVVPLGVKLGVIPPLGVMPLGVMPRIPLGVMDSGVAAPGVSSHRERRLLALGVGVSCMRSPPLSVRGVSAHPLPWPGVSVSKKKHKDIKGIFGKSQIGLSISIPHLRVILC